MYHINTAEYLKQTDKVKEVLRCWVFDNLQGLDMFSHPIGGRSYDILLLSDIEFGKKPIGTFTEVITGKQFERSLFIQNDLIPLLTETQLRKFIEEKTGFKIGIEYVTEEDMMISYYSSYKCIGSDRVIANEPLEAYWQVACKIAEAMQYE